MPKFNGLKFIFLALLAAAFICLAMCGVTIRRTIAEIANHGNKQESRPSPFPGASAQWRVYTGKWMGSATTREGICNQTFELRPDNKGRLAGYLTLACIPLSGPKANLGAAAFLHMSPRSAILSGEPADSALSFNVEKTIGGSDDCPMTSYRVLPFGTTQLASEWQDGCPGGQMLLSKVGQ